MYNRYIPQQDGSYRKRPMPEQPPMPPKPPSPPTPQPEPERPTCDRCVHRTPPPKPRPVPNTGIGAGQFLRSLLPGSFDAEDLLIVLLLLLMGSDYREDRNLPLLTLALYLFL